MVRFLLGVGDHIPLSCCSVDSFAPVVRKYCHRWGCDGGHGFPLGLGDENHVVVV